MALLIFSTACWFSAGRQGQAGTSGHLILESTSSQVLESISREPPQSNFCSGTSGYGSPDDSPAEATRNKRNAETIGVGPIAPSSTPGQLVRRSRHLPVIPFAGSCRSNPNKTGMRLWIDSSPYRALVEQSDSLWTYQRVIRGRPTDDAPRGSASKTVEPWVSQPSGS
jgi:hypothetical protein